MSVIETTSATGSSNGPKRGGFGRKLTISLITVAGAVGIAWLVYAGTYAPLTPGSLGGRDLNTVGQLTDGVNETRYIILGEPGQAGTVRYSVRNNGPFAVTILGYDKKDGGGFEKVEWTRMFPDADSIAGGDKKDVRPFPATVEPGEEITLWASARRGKCSPGTVIEIQIIPLRWSALGINHVYDLPLTIGDHPLPLDVCYPKEALKHLSK